MVVSQTCPGQSASVSQRSMPSGATPTGIASTTAHPGPEGWYTYPVDDNEQVCYRHGEAGILNGFACRYSYCDDIILGCAEPQMNIGGVQVPARMENCWWSTPSRWSITSRSSDLMLAV